MAKSPTKKTSGNPTKSNAERAYCLLRDMAVTFQLKPGERVNEVDVATKFKMSRAPIREAMNRLATDGLLKFIPNQGFHCRRLSATEIHDMYASRADIEAGAIREALHRSTDEELDVLHALCVSIPKESDNVTIDAMVKHDETFHHSLVQLSGNKERLRYLDHLNAHIFFVRRVNLEDKVRRNTSFAEHREIVSALKRRDSDTCERLIREHLSLSADEALRNVHTGLSRIYAEDVI